MEFALSQCPSPEQNLLCFLAEIIKEIIEYQKLETKLPDCPDLVNIS